MIASTGIVCPVGLVSEAAFSAIRAGISAYAESDFVLSAPDWEPVLGASIPLRPTAAKPGQEFPRLKRLAALAIEECTASYGAELADLPVLIGVRESYRKSAEWSDGDLLRGLANALEVPLHPLSAVVQTGASSVFECLAHARTLLVSGRVTGCLVGGVDSLLNWADLGRLQRCARLRSSATQHGLVPGEAAAFLLVTRDSHDAHVAMAEICGIGVAREPVDTSVLSTGHPTGRGLVEAWSAALADAGLHERAVMLRVSDLTGERYGAMDSLLAVSRLFRSDRNGLPLWHPAQSVGATGAAAGALGVALAAFAAVRGVAPDTGVMLCDASSDDGQRGACLVRARRTSGLPARRRARVPRPHIALVLEQHVENASFLFGLRTRAVQSPEHTFVSFAAIDQRLDAHLEGLRAGGDDARRLCAEAAAADGGAQAAASLLAFEAGKIEEVLALAGSEPATQAGTIAGLSFLDWASIEAQIETLARSPDSAARRVALEVAGRQRAERLLSQLLPRDGSELIPWMQALALTGVQGSLHEIRALLAHADQEVRFWAAYSCALLGDSAGLPALVDAAETEGAQAAVAFSAAAACLPAHEVRAWFTRLLARAERSAIGVLLAGRIGDPAAVPYLLDMMKDPRLSRAAGNSFRAITGIDLHASKLIGGPLAAHSEPSEDPEDEAVELHPEEGWPWPDPTRVAQHWEMHASKLYSAGQRYFFGQLASPARFDDVLRTGTMHERGLAALYAKAARPAHPLFDVAAPAARQAEQLGLRLPNPLG